MSDYFALYSARIVLILTSLFCAAAALVIARRRGTQMNFCSLLLYTYVVAYPFSGLVHLADVEGSNRGYFDLLQGSNRSYITGAAAITLVGGFALVMGVNSARPRDHRLPPMNMAKPKISASEQRLMVVMALVCGVAGITGLMKMNAYAREVGLTRIIGVNQGLARYAYTSTWIVWSIAIAVILVWYWTAKKRNPLVAAALTASGGVLIAMTLFWTGGRSIILLMTLPLIIIMWPAIRGLRIASVLVGGAAIAYYAISITQVRTAGSHQSGQIMASSIDWQWGRFSLLGFSQEWVQNHGFLFGQTLLSSISNIVYGTLSLVGINIPKVHYINILEVTGSGIIGDPSAVHIVPGMNAELYLNFGYVGVVAGNYILGRTAAWTDNRLASCQTPAEALLLAYFGSLLVLRTVIAESGALLGYLVFRGAPLIILAVLVHLTVDWRRTKKPVGGGAQPPEESKIADPRHTAEYPSSNSDRKYLSR